MIHFLTPVAKLIFNADKTQGILNHGNPHKSQVQCTCKLLVPVEWIYKSLTTIFSQVMFLSNIGTAFFKKEA